jgi:hypothetical protein
LRVDAHEIRKPANEIDHVSCRRKRPSTQQPRRVDPKPLRQYRLGIFTAQAWDAEINAGLKVMARPVWLRSDLRRRVRHAKPHEPALVEAQGSVPGPRRAPETKSND